MSLPYTYQGDSLVIFIEGKSHIINRETHPNFQKVIDAIKDREWDLVPDLVDMTRALANFTSENNDIEVKDGDVTYRGRPFHNAMTDRLLAMLEEGFPVDALCNFLCRLKQNPSKRAVDELYGFLENNDLPITPEGNFYAYKKVREDFKDIHSGTFDNSPGSVCSMPRNEVNEDKDQTCSTGLHFCSLEYLPRFGRSSGDRVVILEIDPADVVSIPSDYNNAKGRACRYTVVAEHNAKERDTTPAFTSVVSSVKWTDNLREVREYGDGKWRYTDTGTYATAEDVQIWLDYLDSDSYTGS